MGKRLKKQKSRNIPRSDNQWRIRAEAARVVRTMRKKVLERKNAKENEIECNCVMVVSILLYGCEMWTLWKRYESKLQAFEMICPRRVEDVTRMDR